MREGIPGAFVAAAAVLCCALPILLAFGALSFAGGFALNQITFVGLGISLLALAGIVFLVFRRRKR